MATARDLKLEQVAVDSFFKNQGRAPSSPSDWKTIHTASYGTSLPPELASLPMYQSASPVTTTPTAPAPLDNSLSYRGQNISDSALKSAGDSALSYNTSGFLDKVKERLQKKFKPESEVLGLGSFSATLGALDPSGVMQGINEKSGQFRRKGALALQALSTANDIYSEQAKLAADKLNLLDSYRTDYEKVQKGVEEDMKDLALSIAKTGKAIPNEILDLLPANMRAVYQGLPKVLYVPKASGGGGGGSGLLNIDGADNTTPAAIPMTYEEFLANESDNRGMSIDPSLKVNKDDYEAYKVRFAADEAAKAPAQSEESSNLDTMAQQYKNKEVTISELTAAYGKAGKDKILARASQLTKESDGGRAITMMTPAEAKQIESLLVKDSSGFVNASVYAQVVAIMESEFKNGGAEFIKLYPPGNFLDPTDSTAQLYLKMSGEGS